MDSLLQLAERCEAAEGPDRELNCLIASEIGIVPTGYEYRENRGYPMFFQGGGLSARSWDPPRFTASLDAAMTLVPEGFGYTLVRVPGSRTEAVVREWRFKDGKWWTSNGYARAETSAATDALALAAAALRARHSQGVSDNG